MHTLRTVVILSLVVATVIASVGVAPAQDQGNVNTSRLRRGVSASGIQEHLKKFQEIADSNDDTRVAGSRGYNESVDYVADRLKRAGLKVTRQNFSFDLFIENSSAFARTSPDPRTYTPEEFIVMEYSGNGDVAAPLVATTDIQINPSPGGSTSGCEAADFPAAVDGAVALIQRGTCPFRQKAENAAAAGAVGVVIFNEGNENPNDDRFGPINGTLDPPRFDLPTVGTSYAAGEELVDLLAQGPVEVSLAVDADVKTTRTSNVIAETKTGNKDRTVVVGAHLDSVAEGPGMNDNGSGSAVLLEVAEEMAKLKITPQNRIRFAFWGAEESGLIGSDHYVNSLNEQQLGQIILNLNFDMLGSSNYVRFVYDGDGSDTPDSGPDGSGLIEAVFNDYFASQNLETDPTAFDGRSDYLPFILAGIPAGGLFSGAEDIKDNGQEAVYGGVAEIAYDPCYHAACDTLDERDQPADVRAVEDAYGERVIVGNINRQSLEELGDAAAHATLVFAQRTEPISDGARRGARRQAEFDYRGPLAVR